MRKLLKDENGQAVVEYILGLVLAVSVLVAITTLLRRSLFGLWESFSKDVSAACPGCPPDPAIRIR